MLLIFNDISIEEELSKTEHMIANFHNDKEITKEYEILDEDEHYVATNMNMNKNIKNQLNNNDLTISGNHPVTNKIKNGYIKKNAKKPLNDKEYDICFMNNNNYLYVAATEVKALHWQNFHQSVMGIDSI